VPKVSVVTPSYNHARFLPDRINSILEQTFQDFEWIIIDDCSTDGSQDVLRKLAGHDPRVTLLFHTQNMGMAATTREAIGLSSGEYIYRAESDDACDIRFLERMVQVLDAHPQVGLAYCRALHMDENGYLWGGLRQPKEDFVLKGTDFFLKLVLGRYSVSGPSMIFRREAHDRVGGFGVGPFIVSCDYHFVLRICLYYDIAYVSDPLAYHRLHGTNLSVVAKQAFDLDEVFRESYGILADIFDYIPNEKAELRDLRPAAMRNLTLHYAAGLFIKTLLERKWQAARQILKEVERYDPGGTSGMSWILSCMYSLLWSGFYQYIYEPFFKLTRKSLLSWRAMHS
jgi:glycosyltransferase involved in cell wall biosynthesis